MIQIQTLSSWADAIPPWPSTGLWLSANQALSHAIDDRRDELSDAIDLAQQIRIRLRALDPLMHDLCAQTCPACTENCCRRATVWFDFRDLLVLHMVQETVPPGQLITAAHQPCRYLESDGCVLIRTQRPFICTWFICAAQKKRLDQWPLSKKTFFWNSLEALKKGRNKLEHMFIQTVIK